MLVATRVDPTRVGGGQLSLPGVAGTNLHTMSWVLSESTEKPILAVTYLRANKITKKIKKKSLDTV